MQELMTKIEAAIKDLPQTNKDELSKKLDLSFEEHFAWQEAQALAFASGKITFEASNFLYQSLGGTLHTFNRQPLTVKIAVTQMIKLIMEIQV